MALAQPMVLPGVYTIAAGATQLPAASPDNVRMLAWASDRPVSAGYMGSDGTSWTSMAPAAFAVGAPVTRTLSFATAYQASTSTKPANVSIIIDCTTTVALGSAQANTVELIIGATNAVASGTGTLADTFRSDLSVSIIISLGFTGRQALQCTLPIGYYFAVRRTVGTGMTIISAFDQVLG